MNNTKQRPKNQNMQYSNRAKANKKKPISFFGAFVITVILACAVIFVLYKIGGKSFVSKIFSPNGEKISTRTEFSLPLSPKRQNILVMGVDPNNSDSDPFKGARSDTIILVSVAPYGKSVNAISIPRDSKVYIPDSHGVDKINHSFAYGGAKLTVKTVEETLGVKVNHYLVISNKGVRDLVDAMGGLPIYIEKDMRYQDSASGLYINLTKGDHVLNGKDAEGYLRFRKDALGDIGRVQRQQWFLRAIAKKAKDPAFIPRIPQVLKVLSKYIQTNMSFYDLSQYAALSKTIDLNTFEVATLPGAPSRKGFVSYWILDPEKTQDLVNKLVYREKVEPTRETNKAGILYGATRGEDARRIKALLEAEGFEVLIQQRKGLGHEEIAVHNSEVSSELISAVKQKVPDLLDFQTVYDSVGFNKANSDFTIVLTNH